MASGTSISRPADLRWVAVGVATGAVLAALGFWRMFAHFPGYDDEGYILQTARDYLANGGLYDVVYTQYGPAFYVLVEAVQRLTGAAVDHTFARWFTLALWFGGAAGTGALVLRATGSRPMAWFAWVTAFLFLHQLSEEAFHPGAVIVAVLPAALVAVLELRRRGRPAAAAALAGAAAAWLALLKINVGVLFAAGCGIWVLLAAGGPGRWAPLRWAGVAGGLLFAAVLMHGLLGEAWVRVFLGVFAAGLLGLAAVVRSRRMAGGRETGGFAAAALAVVVAVAGVAIARGSTPAAMLEGVLLGPLRHADAYSFAVDWRPGTVVFALASVALLGMHGWLERRGRREAAARLVVALRLAQVAGLLAVVALLGHFRVIGALFSYALPWLWVWVVRLDDGPADGADSEARELTACVLLLQALHAYPVGGIQICWGVFPIFALVAMAVPETERWLERRTTAGGRRARALAGAMALVAAGKLAVTAWEYRRDHAAGIALELPGAEEIRLSEREVAAYQTIVANAVLHTDRLFSMPGMFSFNLWSGRPPPTHRNTTLWHALLGEADQREIVVALEHARRPGLVVDGAFVAGWHARGAPPAGPLGEYLLRKFRPVFALQGLGFWAPAGSAPAPLATAWRGTGSFRACLFGTGGPVAAMEIVEADRSGGGGLRFDAGNARVFLEPVNPDGSPRGAQVEAGWPLRFDGLAWVTVRSDALPPLGADRAWLLLLKSADGRRVAVAPFVDAP